MGAEHYRWLIDNLQAMARTGEDRYPPTKAAKEADVWASTITEFIKEHEKNPNSKRTLHAATIEKLCRKFNWKPPAANVIEMPTPSAPRAMRTEGQVFTGSVDGDMDHAIECLMRGRDEAEPWILNGRGLELAGYIPGDTVIIDRAEKPESGDPVCAEVFNIKTSRYEIVFRIYDPPFLVPVTMDKALQRPIHIDPERVTVKGVLTHLLRSKNAA